MSEQESLLPPEERDKVEHPKRHNLEPFRDSSRTRELRFWLNILFMIGAIAGLVVYSCGFKFIELALRILKI